MATIVTKNSSTASAVPTTSDLVQGELAVNLADKRLFTENASSQIIELGTNPSTITTATATVTGTLTANGTFASSNAVLTGGTINGVVIGGSTPLAITGTTVTANTGFVGGLTGNVTGNLTGNVTGNVTGDLTGNVTGNVTASTGTTTLNNLVVNGTADFTNTKLVNVTTPVAGTDAANKDYVDTSVAAVIDAAPAALDTLNELAAALGDDANFSSTITTSIATKLPLAGGTMTGVIEMGTSKITGLGDPTANQDAATKNYVDTQDSTKLSTTGGTMSGAIAMGTNKITGAGDPTSAQDVATKAYTDSILGSATSAAASAAAAATSESNAATSASNASTSETNASNSASAAATSATNAANSFDEFDDIYLGAKSTAPAVDNDGDPLAAGALYFNTVSNTMFVYSGSSWAAAGSAVNGTAERQEYIATSGQTNFSATYDVGFVDVYLNGSKLIPTTDFTATDGATIVLTTGAVTGDNVSIIAYGAFNVADTYTQAQADAKFAQVANNLSDLDNAATALTNLGLTATAAELNTLDGVTATTAELNILDGVTATTTELNYVDGVTSNIQTQIDNIDALPSQTGNDGLFLTTDGTDASWAAAGGGLQSIQVFTSSGTWTKPSGITKIKIIGTGGGGGGGGPRTSTTAGAGGGGAAGYFEKFIDVSAISSETVTIGAGGAAQSTANTTGNSGGATSFGSHASANGGSGGAANTGGGGGGAGGSTTGGDISIAGVRGGGGDGYTRDIPGYGGSTPFGGQGTPHFGGGVPSATGFGSGGAGSFGSYSGGAGKSGIIIVEEYA